MERVNVVINYDMPDSPDSYLHRVGRAGRFGTKGLALSFVASDEDKEMLKQIQDRFEVDIPAMPEKIDVSTYSNFSSLYSGVVVSVNIILLVLIFFGFDFANTKIYSKPYCY